MLKINTSDWTVRAALLFVVCGVLYAASAVRAQTEPPESESWRSFDVDVPATQEWVDTNIDLRGGAKLRFTASGSVTYPADDSYAGRAHTSGTFGPSGLARGWADLIHQYAVKDAGHGALIGRIGSDTYAQPFLVGESKEYDVPVAGRLFVGINQSLSEASTATGSFRVKIEILDEGSAESTNAGGPADASVEGISPELLGKLPRRVSDPNGKPGDMVNVLIVGTQDEVLHTFDAAGWVKVDQSVENTALIALMDSLEKETI